MHQEPIKAFWQQMNASENGHATCENHPTLQGAIQLLGILMHCTCNCAYCHENSLPHPPTYLFLPVRN